MVCLTQATRKLDFIKRALLWNIPLPRAIFLASCSHTSIRGDVIIPYNPTIQIKEAIRLGIGFGDIAKMMGMTKEELESYQLNFQPKSRLPKPPGFGGYNLLTQDQYESHNTKPKKRKYNKRPKPTPTYVIQEI